MDRIKRALSLLKITALVLCGREGKAVKHVVGDSRKLVRVYHMHRFPPFSVVKICETEDGRGVRGEMTLN